MDDLSYLYRLPAEVWADIFSYFLQKYSPDSIIDTPYPLAGPGSAIWDRKTAITLAITCKHFYDLVAPLLADYVKVNDLSPVDSWGQSQRSTTTSIAQKDMPSTVVVELHPRLHASELHHDQHPWFGGVTRMFLTKPWWSFRDPSTFFDALARTYGPQVSSVFLVASDHGWLHEDLVSLSFAMPQLGRLHISDLRHHDEGSDSESNNDHDDDRHNTGINDNDKDGDTDEETDGSGEDDITSDDAILSDDGMFSIKITLQSKNSLARTPQRNRPSLRATMLPSFFRAWNG